MREGSQDPGGAARSHVQFVVEPTAKERPKLKSRTGTELLENKACSKWRTLTVCSQWGYFLALIFMETFMYTYSTYHTHINGEERMIYFRIVSTSRCSLSMNHTHNKSTCLVTLVNCEHPTDAACTAVEIEKCLLDACAHTHTATLTDAAVEVDLQQLAMLYFPLHSDYTLTTFFFCMSQ